MCLLTLLTVVGNATVLLALRRVASAPANAPLASLAVADLLLGLTVLPLATARECFVFCMGQIWCSLWRTTDVMCCTASILSLCALGFERWSGITEPLKKARRTRLARLYSWVLWPIAVAVAIPTALVPTRQSDKPCAVNTNIGYVFYSITISFYIPAGVMVVLYARVLRTLASPLIVRAHRGSRSPSMTITKESQSPKKAQTGPGDHETAIGVITPEDNCSESKATVMTESVRIKKCSESDHPLKSLTMTVSPSVYSSKVIEKCEHLNGKGVKQTPVEDGLSPTHREEKTILKKLKLFLSPNKTHLAVPTDAFISISPKSRNPNSFRKNGPGSPGHLARRQRRATRTIVMLMSLFLVCWTPFFIMLPIDAVCACVSDAAWRWCSWLGYANSALDPLVYAIASPSVRRALHTSLSLSRSDHTTSVATPMRSSINRISIIAKNNQTSPNNVENLETSNVKRLEMFI